MWSPYPRKSTSWEKRYQFTVAISSLLALGGVAAFTISTIQLRSILSTAAKSLPALDGDLTVKWDGGFNGLVRFKWNDGWAFGTQSSAADIAFPPL